MWISGRNGEPGISPKLNLKMIPSIHIHSSTLLPPLLPSLCPGAGLDLFRLPLWCGGWQALFDYFCGLWIRSGKDVEDYPNIHRNKDIKVILLSNKYKLILLL